MGEYWQGGGKGYDSVVFITLGTGVGSGIILDGRMIHGSKGLGGEIGHIIVDPSEKEPCSCGHYGCLNQIASATGIVYRAKRMLQAEDTASCMRGLEKLTCKDVFDAAKAGDAVAVKSVRNCLSFLGKSISDVSYTVDPDVFIIGGGVAKAGDLLFEPLRRYLKAQTYGPHYEKLRILPAQFSNEAGIIGAARMALEEAAARQKA
jgi:glucokinase